MSRSGPRRSASTADHVRGLSKSPVKKGGELLAMGNAELRPGAVEVAFDGADRHLEFVGDLPVGDRQGPGRERQCGGAGTAALLGEPQGASGHRVRGALPAGPGESVRGLGRGIGSGEYVVTANLSINNSEDDAQTATCSPTTDPGTTDTSFGRPSGVVSARMQTLTPQGTAVDRRR